MDSSHGSPSGQPRRSELKHEPRENAKESNLQPLHPSIQICRCSIGCAHFAKRSLASAGCHRTSFSPTPPCCKWPARALELSPKCWASPGSGLPSSSTTASDFSRRSPNSAVLIGEGAGEREERSSGAAGSAGRDGGRDGLHKFAVGELFGLGLGAKLKRARWP